MPSADGSLYLIPALLSQDTAYVLPAYIREGSGRLRHFFVENERTARRFLRMLDREIPIDALSFSLVNTHHAPDTGRLERWLREGLDVGVLSEAGYPCIADPGSLLVKKAHQIGARVIPLVGPNSMLLALAASGFNGQRFCFSGYVPVKGPERTAVLRALEKKVVSTGETQLFMDTPYRNNALLQDIIACLRPSTLLCIAADLTAPTELIRTKSVGQWKEDMPDLHKRPAVFLLGR
jgi:16S rRNA (cytidine1402-2'-O)-methyltransferase